MFCYKCGQKNFKSVNFCFLCGAKQKRVDNKTPKKGSVYMNIKGELNFLKSLAHKMFVFSKNKYLNVFLLLVFFTFSVSFLSYVIVNLGSGLSDISKAMLSLSNAESDRYFVRAHLERLFRNFWIELILIFILFVFLVSIFVMIYYMASFALSNRNKK